MANNILFLRLLFICLAVLLSFKLGFSNRDYNYIYNTDKATTYYSPLDNPRYFNPSSPLNSSAQNYPASITLYNPVQPTNSNFPYWNSNYVAGNYYSPLNNNIDSNPINTFGPNARFYSSVVAISNYNQYRLPSEENTDYNYNYYSPVVKPGVERINYVEPETSVRLNAPQLLYPANPAIASSTRKTQTKPSNQPADYAQDIYSEPIEGFSEPGAGSTSKPDAIDYQPDPKTITPQKKFYTPPNLTIIQPLGKTQTKPSNQPSDYAQDIYSEPIEGFSEPGAGSASKPDAIDYQPKPKTITAVDARLAKPEFNSEYPTKEEDEEE